MCLHVKFSPSSAFVVPSRLSRKSSLLCLEGCSGLSVFIASLALLSPASLPPPVVDSMVFSFFNKPPTFRVRSPARAFSFSFLPGPFPPFNPFIFQGGSCHEFGRGCPRSGGEMSNCCNHPPHPGLVLFSELSPLWVGLFLVVRIFGSVAYDLLVPFPLS